MDYSFYQHYWWFLVSAKYLHNLLEMPFVLWYIFKAWKALNSKQIDEAEMNCDDHKY